MTNHLRAIDIKEYAKALDVAKEFADRAEKAEAAVRRVRELHYAYDAMDGLQRCGCCGHPWPCLTALALGGGDDD